MNENNEQVPAVELSDEVIKVIEDCGLEISDAMPILTILKQEDALSGEQSELSPEVITMIEDCNWEVSDVMPIIIAMKRESAPANDHVELSPEMVAVIEGCNLEVSDVMPILVALKRESTPSNLQEATVFMREAIQLAEPFGLVRIEDGTPITGALESDCGVVLVKE